MPPVTINFVADILGPTTIVIDDMPPATLTELRGLWDAEEPVVVFFEGRKPDQDWVGGYAINVRSITAITEDES